jgi:hypothetical protein
MTRDRRQPPQEPTADQLAAYFDGALTGPERAAVEAWLTDQPDAGRDAAFADADDDLVRACQATQPCEPAPDAWDAVLGRIAAAVPPGAPPRRGYLGTVIAAAAATAAALGLILVGRALWPAPASERQNGIAKLLEGIDLGEVLAQIERDKLAAKDRKTVPEVDEPEPFPVLAPWQVRVISMEGDDVYVEIDGQLVKSLVVGEPPVAEDVLLPTSYDKTKVVSAIDPELRLDGWSVPMVVDPAVLAKGWQP